jgi:glycosyltransferase involved in cell wall biosynthesis
VTVYIPTYNRSGMLKEAIESVLAQSFEDFELIISDNASEDETEAIVKSFNDRRIIYLRNDRNIGSQKNWQRCLSLSKGRYITILSDDDQMMPGNLALKVEVLSKNEQVGLVHSKYHLINDEGTIIKYNTNWRHGPDRDCDMIERGLDVVEKMLLTFNIINPSTVMFKRECYERLGGFSKRLKLTDDWEYWMHIACYYDVAFLAKPLINWRVHAGSLTSQLAIDQNNMRTPLVILEEVKTRRLILQKHPGKISYRNHLRKRIQLNVINQFATQIDKMLGLGGPNPKVRRFVLEMCRAFPPIIFEKVVWKAFLKTILRRSTIEKLKRICPI